MICVIFSVVAYGPFITLCIMFSRSCIFYSHQVEAVEWPFADNDNGNASGFLRSNGCGYQSIADYLSQKMICLVINLPLRQHRTTPAITKGYLTRRMAVEYSVPLVTDVKCAKLLIKVK